MTRFNMSDKILNLCCPKYHFRLKQLEIDCFDFCVLKKKRVHYRIGQCVRPSVYSITLHNYIRLSWNFVHIMISLISQSSSKMRRIRQEMDELSKKLSFLTIPSLRGSTGIFQKKIFLRIIHNIYKSTQFLTLIPNLILVLN